MSAFLMVSNPELREEDRHLSVYTMRMPDLVSPICYKTMCLGLLRFFALSKKYPKLVQNAVKSFQNKAELLCMPWQLPVLLYLCGVLVYYFTWTCPRATPLLVASATWYTRQPELSRAIFSTQEQGSCLRGKNHKWYGELGNYSSNSEEIKEKRIKEG